MKTFAAKRRRSRRTRHLDEHVLSPLQTTSRAPVQAILRTAASGVRVGEADNRYEREADHIASRMARALGPVARPAMAVPGIQPAARLPALAQHITPFAPTSMSAGVHSVLRKGASGQTCQSPSAELDEQRELAMPKAKDSATAHSAPAADSGPASPAVARTLAQSRGRGEPLARPARALMERAFGYDFSRVRVHTDSAARHMNRDLQALAFTSGSDIYFSPGAYRPHSAEGQHLLAHELTHVVQQERGDPGATAQRQTRGAVIQRYSLWGFSASQEALMKSAISTAFSTVKGCSYPSWLFKGGILKAILFSAYHYRPNMSDCGWTIPASNYIQISANAFSASACCDLASTIAHEASHIAGYTEGYARAMECSCFSCSC